MYFPGRIIRSLITHNHLRMEWIRNAYGNGLEKYPLTVTVFNFLKHIFFIWKVLHCYTIQNFFAY